MRLVDADETLHKAWQNFYKQEDEHKKNIDDYDIMRDQFYEQSGFECCQQTIVNAPTVEAIPKDQYEARLKADMVAMLEELLSDVEKMSDTIVEGRTITVISWVGMQKKICNLIQQKINKLQGNQDENNNKI